MGENRNLGWGWDELQARGPDHQTGYVGDDGDRTRLFITLDG